MGFLARADVPSAPFSSFVRQNLPLAPALRPSDGPRCLMTWLVADFDTPKSGTSWLSVKFVRQ
ncbi:hypothetical protein SAZ_04190 [Streptomyces noursei ZPM]|nr:hypothetical protein SAZ_04190 [Streptomyces noursei ZPM]EOS97538.1 hypothetical protein K530_43478 [Streptomyces noursei CCRC 11814]EXU89030.1 hypothetical protein P354_25110 [Streptomyces noursei PD-1]